MKSRRIRIPLTKTELDYVFDLAAQRNEKEQIFGSGVYGGSIESALQAHKIGIVAEAAIAKLFNTKFDQKIYKLSGDSGIDIVLPNVGKCAIKATTYYKDPLLRAEVEHHSKDISTYICCYVNPKTYEVWFIGWVSGEEVESLGEKKKLLTNGPLNYIMKEYQLHDPQELIDIACLKPVYS